MKKTCFLLLSFLLIVSGVVANGGAEGADAKDIPKITVMQATWGTVLPDPADNFVVKTINEALNIELDVPLSGNSADYQNALNVRLAGGNAPEYFQIPGGRPFFVKLAEDGVLMNLESHMGDLTPVVEFVGRDNLEGGRYQGTQYALPKAKGIRYNSLWIRRDWLDNLGLESPTTVDEMLAVAKAFTFNDPDGNGADDTYGMSDINGGLGVLNSICGAYGTVPNPLFWIENGDGETVFVCETPEFKAALAKAREFVEAGVIDPEQFTAGGQLMHQKVIQGQVGMPEAEWPRMTKNEYTTQMLAVNPNALWEQVALLESENGKTPVYGMEPVISTNIWSIPASLEKEDFKLAKVKELLNYVSTEGNLLVQFGLEGRHYNIENGEPIATDLLFTESNFTWIYQFTGRPETSYLGVKFAPQKEYIAFAANQTHAKDLNALVDSIEGYNRADASRFAEEEIIKFLFGSRDLTEYDQFLETLFNTFGEKANYDYAVKQFKEKGYL